MPTLGHMRHPPPHPRFPITSPWEFVSLRVKCADGLWVTGPSFDPEVLKMRGMVLASEEDRKWKTDASAALLNVRVCVSVWVCMCVCV